MDLVNIHHINVRYKGRVIKGERWHAKGQLGEVLLLHGGGRSSKSGFLNLRKSFISIGLGSLAFDYIGHGATGGTLHGFSLEDRLKQTKLIIDSVYGEKDEINVIGFSMGAYIATLLSKEVNIQRLGLIIPAMYTKLAFAVPFGERFSTLIRKQDSWKHSDGFDIVKYYRGRLLVVSAEHDHIIPHEIPHKLFSNAISAQWKHHHIVPDCTHDLGRLFNENPNRRYMLLGSILGWYFSDSWNHTEIKK
ncbi:alpha/beta hydrolase [Enterobacter quasiroggenkampii]|uniref:alpha/beta hydrolase n=1 Tax=Enterobacter quasiroggenkampii TaxID=2497436 RepID=UPI0021D16009|nr:alpha/beta hydrolase [Enterobacter quasiroggenkampii]MCU6389348.1 alpha/beta hydrolase [Enterobacter quasiroggenkampii]